MIDKNIFINFLIMFYKYPVSKSVYLEGGAALTFLYGLERVFSFDLDFTIEDIHLMNDLIKTVESVTKDLGFLNVKVIQENTNKLIVFSSKDFVLQIDVYVLSSNLFSWEDNLLINDSMESLVRSHSLIDIFAEKITNIIQNDRTEFKDIYDINRIYEILKNKIDPLLFKKYLNEKILGKKIQVKISVMDSFMVKKFTFGQSYDTYESLNKDGFDVEFEKCFQIIKLVS